jgi:magnesium-transporting ATPase (P-type)
MDTGKVQNPHHHSADDISSALRVSSHGLTRAEASERLSSFGPNILPTSKTPGIGIVFLRQFRSPLIYVLVAAAILSIAIKEWSDAAFIFAVLLINAIIGTIQEYSAQKAADALQKMVTTNCRVLREGEAYEISAEELVPGDMLLLESGDKVPADVRILNSFDLDINEAALTGESLAVRKDAAVLLPVETAMGDRINMAFAGTLVDRGRAQGIVVATAIDTELGQIATAVISEPAAKAPLMIRMERFTHKIAIFVGIAALIMAAVASMQGTPLTEVLLLAVALAVSAIPEGLPVALTVALAIGMRRMSRRNVIIRRLVAVESLGSCTYIATDKTGTLTVNQMTARQIAIPDGDNWTITGEGMAPVGEILTSRNTPAADEGVLLEHICRAAVLPNEGFFGRREEGWVHHGDAVDVAFLVFAHKAGHVRAEMLNEYPEQATIAFEAEQLFSASLNMVNGKPMAFVKGAVEQLLSMCDCMASKGGDVPLDADVIEHQAQKLADQGYRVLALAEGDVVIHPDEIFSEAHITGLTLLGLVCMIDPLRSEAKNAIVECQNAGIEVAMVTGDHPATALAIARELNLETEIENIVTGTSLKHADGPESTDQLTQNAHVFARVEPRQKLEIIQSLQRQGHYVAVSGDGANDAPALRAAHVGVAMGKTGTDVARETADLIITDDNFASIVAGIEEGRVAYSNVRKVIFLLISTGAAEIVLFTLALFTGLPLPLMAVQLLWLNLVTNGIQDVALAFEPAEGDELSRPPRSTSEPIFNRIMLERVIISAIVIGVVAFGLFQWLLEKGYSLDEARNGTLLLMVLFENIHVFNCRSETRSAFLHNPMRNPILLIGTLTAQAIHIGAMYTPWIRDVLHIQPVSPQHWLELLGLALSVLVVMELHKVINKYFGKTNSID